jgi:hypothetical protein
MTGRRPRQLVEEGSFVQCRDQLIPDTKRWDEFWRGVEWVLCRDASVGLQVYDLPVHILTTNPAPGMPRLRVMYLFDDVLVRVLWVERA